MDKCQRQTGESAAVRRLDCEWLDVWKWNETIAYELSKLIATTARYSRVILHEAMNNEHRTKRLKPCKENMTYSQFSVEKRTLFLPSPFISKFESVSLALHHTNFAMLLLTELTICVKSFSLSSGEPEYIPYKQTDRQTDDNSYQLGRAF